MIAGSFTKPVWIADASDQLGPPSGMPDIVSGGPISWRIAANPLRREDALFQGAAKIGFCRDMRRGTVPAADLHLLKRAPGGPICKTCGASLGSIPSVRPPRHCEHAWAMKKLPVDFRAIAADGLPGALRNSPWASCCPWRAIRQGLPAGGPSSPSSWVTFSSAPGSRWLRKRSLRRILPQPASPYAGTNAPARRMRRSAPVHISPLALPPGVGLPSFSCRNASQPANNSL